MPKTTQQKVEDLKRLLLQARPVMIFGADFMAFNYGDGEFAGGRPSLISSNSGHAYIDRGTMVWRFGTQPNVRLSEASHFDAGQEKIDLAFSEVRAEIESNS